MRVKLRLAAVTFALLVPALMLGRWSLGAGEPSSVPPPSLPSRVGAWTATLEQTLEAEVLAQIEPDAYRVQLYEAPDRPPIWLYVGIYAGRAGSGKGAHDPKVCYPAQGWEIEHSQTAVIPMEDGQDLHAQRLGFRRGLAREAVLYWFQPARRWPVVNNGAEQLLRIIDALEGRPQYAFVRLSAPSTATPGSDLAEFAVEVAPAIRGLVDGVGTPALE
jgi:EpsI family protein